MIYKTLRYTVKPDSIGAVKKAIAQFIASIRDSEPGTLVYEAFQEHNDASFVHNMIFVDEASEQIHKTAEHTDDFVTLLYPHCTTLPVIHALTVIDSHRSDDA